MFGPDETASNRLGALLEETDRVWMADRRDGDDHLAPDGRVMEILSEHLCQGWLEGYLLTGRHGLFNCYEAFIHIVDSMFNQHAKWLKVTQEIPWRSPIASLNYLLSSHVWRQDHNGFSHQDPGFINHVINKKAEIVRVYLPPDANCLLSVADHCLRSRDYVNVIVAGKQPSLDYLSMEDAITHCARGIGIWEWASSEDGAEPDVVLACAGDIPTLETLAAAALLREHLPDLRVRVVNVVDLMRLQPESEHPHGLPDAEFDALFTTSQPVIFAYHGYPWLIHRLTYRRRNHDNLHVRGYKEEGTTTTPFDMVMLNDLDRFHLVMDVIDRVPHLGRDRRRAAPADGRRAAAPPRLHARARRRLARRPRLDLARLTAAVRVLVANAGSSSLKLSLLDARRRGAVARELDAPARGYRARSPSPRRSPGSRSPRTRSGIGSCTAASASSAAVRLDPDVLSALRELTELAPLHQPKSLAAVDAVSRALPDVPEVACFDTAFHATLPAAAATYALPATLARALWRAPLRLPRAVPRLRVAARRRALAAGARRVVTCHLGAGASLCAVLDGRSVDTTMGFTPLEGLAMATRSGSVDPGLLLWLQEQAGLSPQRDGRRAGARVGARGPRRNAGHARGACSRRRPTPGSRSTSTRTACAPVSARWRRRSEGLDALVFTGGVGERSPRVRRGRLCGPVPSRRGDRRLAQRESRRGPRRRGRRIRRRGARCPRPRGPRDRAPGASAAALGRSPPVCVAPPGVSVRRLVDDDPDTVPQAARPALAS